MRQPVLLEEGVKGGSQKGLRYNRDMPNYLRIDEKYDNDDPADWIDAKDPFRIQRYYINGPSQLGQIVKTALFDYSSKEPVSTDYYYGYDILGNVSVISNNSGAEADQFEQDAFGLVALSIQVCIMKIE